MLKKNEIKVILVQCSKQAIKEIYVLTLVAPVSSTTVMLLGWSDLIRIGVEGMM
jgi:hypothetical protein